jgi:tol-pal system protein YbgF
MRAVAMVGDRPNTLIGRAAAMLLVIWCGLGVNPAAAQDLQPLLERVQRMERDLALLQQQVNGGKPPAGGAAASDATVAATVKVAQIESDLRATTGQLEEINFSVGQLRQRLDRLVTDVDFRLSSLEKIASGGAPPAGAAVAVAPPAGAPPGAAAAADTGTVPPAAGASPDQPTPLLGPQPRNLGTIPLGAVPPPGAVAMPPPPGGPQVAAAPGGIAPTTLTPAATMVRLPPGTPKDQYDYAFDLLKRAEYAQAEQALRQFVTTYPTDPLAGNAQYWLAETYYVRNNYSEAAAQFLKGYQTYPQSPKAADNLFKLGLTLTILGKVQEACSAYQRFDREYATAAGALKRRVVDERQRLGCA